MSEHSLVKLVACLLLPAAFLPACQKTGSSVHTTTAPPDSIQITSYGPDSVHGGDILTVYGKNLPTDNTSYTVTLNGMLFDVIASTPDSIKAVVPKMAGSGYAMVTVDSVNYKGPFLTYEYVVTVTTVAGVGYAGNLSTSAQYSEFNCPWGITADANGDLYIADSYNRELRKYTAAGASVSEIDIPGNVTFYDPYNLALDRNTHNLYVTDFNAHLLKLTPAGVATNVYNDTTPPNAGVAFGPDSYLYMANNTTGNIIRLDTNGNNASIFGTGILTPRNLIFDKSGNLYIGADGIYKITPGGMESQVALDPRFKGWEIARDTLGNIYEADHFNNNLRMIEASTGNIFTIAGSGTAADADGTGLNASFNGPMGLCIDDKGNLYMTTYNFTTTAGDEIRKITVQ